MRLLVAAVLALSSVNASAGDALAGTLSLVHFMPDGVVVAYTDGVRSNVPDCAQAQPSRFEIDAKTQAGKIQLSGLLTAYAAGKPVRIVGTGTCLAYGSETISYFYTAD